MRGGRRPGSGRPPGARNRKTIKVQDAIEQFGMTPLDYMVSVMRNEDNDPRTRLEAARHAAPYVHSRLSATDLTVNDSESLDRQALVARLRMLIANNSELLGDLGHLPAYDPDNSENTNETPR
jgi:hypothetical protein